MQGNSPTDSEEYFYPIFFNPTFYPIYFYQFFFFKFLGRPNLMEQLKKNIYKAELRSNKAKERKVLFERQKRYCRIPEKNLGHRKGEKFIREKLERNQR